MGPRAVDGSTTRPFCTMSTRPRATSRRAARRAGSESCAAVGSEPLAVAPSAREPPAGADEATARAASIVSTAFELGFAASSSRMTCSSLRSVAVTLRRRHASEQYFTSAHESAHLARHSMRRPHEAHTFGSLAAEPPDASGSRSRDRLAIRDSPSRFVRAARESSTAMIPRIPSSASL
ncbi:protein of unknown function [Agreia sp. COWG]|nr:protein of unknown function [Agreia sp. COWG]